jgi:septal ring factor EnvC (AmiA/AmiB activator)
MASLLLRRLAEAHALLIASNRHYHANAVQAAIERIENDAKNLRRAHLRIESLKKALDAESKIRDQLEQEIAKLTESTN